MPTVDEQRTVTAAGTLTLRGTAGTSLCRWTPAGPRTAVTVADSIPVRFADYGIPDPSVGPIRAEDNGVLEFRLELRRA